ncbi:DUF4227 family protein [Paenibacillus hexagrammi]|uniref:DUF4227 family protein n=1 Tax=Paenibacillus hexagrammi TaxID=2908839 RepID=A0ABY3SB39_9BACL|nr:DUF4227 family protein [Paenibacillus sp. YPD9-1]UJF31204.1 DUF4227 family protein [Paenibacillus sp. YPD9-1]
MIVSYRKMMARLRFMLIFMALSIVLYQIMTMVTGWIEPAEKYKPPTVEPSACLIKNTSRCPIQALWGNASVCSIGMGNNRKKRSLG